jgi:hypothetical protein
VNCLTCSASVVRTTCGKGNGQEPAVGDTRFPLPPFANVIGAAWRSHGRFKDRVGGLGIRRCPRVIPPAVGFPSSTGGLSAACLTALLSSSGTQEQLGFGRGRGDHRDSIRNLGTTLA